MLRSQECSWTPLPNSALLQRVTWNCKDKALHTTNLTLHDRLLHTLLHPAEIPCAQERLELDTQYDPFSHYILVDMYVSKWMSSDCLILVDVLVRSHC